MIVKVFSNRFPLKTPRIGDVGYDLCSIQEYDVQPWETVRISTGVHIEIIQTPDQIIYGKIEEKSSRGEAWRVCGGVIDYAFRGELIVMLQNMSGKPQHIDIGLKVAQLVFYQIYCPDVIMVNHLEELSTSERGTSGWGSTGSHIE